MSRNYRMHILSASSPCFKGMMLLLIGKKIAKTRISNKRSSTTNQSTHIIQKKDPYRSAVGAA
jgi:hypothetical protein